jgi:hypothetical protein
MSELVTTLAQTGFQDNMAGQQTKTQTETNKRTFDQVMQEQQKTDETKTTTPQTTNQTPETFPQATGVSGVKLEQMRLDLIQKNKEILPPDTTTMSDILPDLLNNKSRLGLLRQAMSEVNNPQGRTEVLGRLSQIEKESNAIEAIMKSNKDLSPGELLGLQARMYQVSQHIEVMSKVVDQMTSGIKMILNTNV